MKKFVLTFLFQVMFITCMKGQVYTAPSKNFFSNMMQVHFVGQYRKGADGLFHYHEFNGREISTTEYNQFTIGLEQFYCYDKTNNMYYFYTDNTLGYYNPQVINYIKYMKNIFKKTDVKNVKEEEAKLLMDNYLKNLHTKFERKNDSIVEKRRIEREKFVKDSTEAAQLKEKEREEYRKKHNKHDLSMSKTYELKCDFCDMEKSLRDYNVLFINGDTLYYMLDEPDIRLLGIDFNEIHYTTLSQEFKNDFKFKEYIDTWKDSIINNSFNCQNAAVLNIIHYNEFKDKICKVAPNGFIQEWGWELNSVQGIEPRFTYFNSTKKTIKYVDFYFSVYNPVGDKCYLKYDHSYIGHVRGVGPVEPFDSGTWDWENATHYTSGDASEMRIVKLIITYMNGTTKTLLGNSIIYDN